MSDLEEAIEKAEATFIHSLPKPIRTTIEAWQARRKAAKEAREAAEEAARREHEKETKKQTKSLMRQRQSKYGLLNAWEIAHFKQCFRVADLDGDGLLTLEEVHELVADLGEEPERLSTWELLDSHATRSELITQHELLVFLSIKRNDEARSDKQGPTVAALAAANQKRVKRLRKRRRKKGMLPQGVQLSLERMQRWWKTSTVESLPALGEFARDALGHERARGFQKLIYSNGWWCAAIVIIVLSSGLLTVDIDEMVRSMRLKGGTPLNTSTSKPSPIPGFAVILCDTTFLLYLVIEIIIKVATQGFSVLADRWMRMDIAVLALSLMKLLFPDWARTLASFAALRIFLLIPRVRELKKLFTSILRSLPNMLVTMGCCAVIWLIFTILGVTFFGGRSHQCAALKQAAGWPGCGVAEGASMYENSAACRYAPVPLPVPYGVVPGVTNASHCGCEVECFAGECVPLLETCKPMTLHGEEVAWVRAFPNFDNAGQAMLALFQISTLDGWANIYYFAMDAHTEAHRQPMRERVFPGPLLYYVVFIIFGVFFICNIFVGVVIDEFQKIKQEYEGSAYLTEEQQQWVNTQKMIFRLKPEKVQVREPDEKSPRRRWCFRLIYDADEHGLPSNAPEGAVYHGKRFEEAVSLCIAINILVLCLWTSPTIPYLNGGDINVYDSLNLCFVIIFAIEALLKVMAYSFAEYIKESGNRFDFFLVCVSIIGLIIVAIAGPDGKDEPAMRALRCFRALRIIRLSQVSPSLLKMMRTIAFATPSVVNIMLVLCIFIFFYAQVGMAFLGTLVYDPYGGGFNRYANFETFTRSFHSLWRMATGDAWSAQFADAYFNPHVPGVNAPPSTGVAVYFLVYMMFMGWVLVSIFVAIILDYFHEAGSEDGLSIAFEDIEEFQRKWLEFDTANTAYISTVDLGLLLYSCDPPLVSVKRRRPGSLFAGNVFDPTATEWVRPTLKQLTAVLQDLDVPDHDGKLHFLEVTLALLQRITGVVSEETLMSQLLMQHPKYFPSLKSLKKITGSTSDPYIYDEIMAHLRRGLEETGLIEEAEDADLDSPKKPKRSLVGRMLDVGKPAPATPAPVTPQRPGSPLADGSPLSSPSRKMTRKPSLANWTKTKPTGEDDLEC